MRKDTSFSERKLTTEEFSKKYWLDGRMPYQYHTGTIEDGRDEREQFVFNNIRALKNYTLDLHKAYKEKADIYRVKKIENSLLLIQKIIKIVGLLSVIAVSLELSQCCNKFKKFSKFFGLLVIFSQPSAVKITKSSMRTPNFPGK